MSAINRACEACRGACCTSLVLPLPPNANNEMVQWLEIRGKREGATIRLDTVCPQLTDGKCGIHETKPRVCRIYPVGGPQCIAAIRAQRPRTAAYLVRLAKQNQEG